MGWTVGKTGFIVALQSLLRSTHSLRPKQSRKAQAPVKSKPLGRNSVWAVASGNVCTQDAPWYASSKRVHACFEMCTHALHAMHTAKIAWAQQVTNNTSLTRKRGHNLSKARFWASWWMSQERKNQDKNDAHAHYTKTKAVLSLLFMCAQCPWATFSYYEYNHGSILIRSGIKNNIVLRLCLSLFIRVWKGVEHTDERCHNTQLHHFVHFELVLKHNQKWGGPRKLSSKDALSLFFFLTHPSCVKHCIA